MPYLRPECIYYVLKKRGGGFFLVLYSLISFFYDIKYMNELYINNSI